MTMQICWLCGFHLNNGCPVLKGVDHRTFYIQFDDIALFLTDLALPVKSEKPALLSQTDNGQTDMIPIMWIDSSILIRRMA